MSRTISRLGAIGAVILALALCVRAQGSNPVKYYYDDGGRLARIADPSGNVAAYNYDSAGNLVSITRTHVAATGPTILSFTPQQGPAGQVVTIQGAGFSATPSADTVKFNGTAATVSAATVTTLSVIVPSGA